MMPPAERWRSARIVLLLGIVPALLAAAAAAQPLARAQDALERGEPVAAEVALRDMLRAGAPRVAVAARMGEAKMRRGDLAAARQWLGPGQFARGEAAHGFHMLGLLDMQEGDLPAAGRAFDRALAFGPRDPSLWVDIGRLRYRGGEQMLAIGASERAVAYGPRDPAALQFRAQLVRDSAGYPAAIPWFERALDASPGDVDILADYAATLGEMGRTRDMLAVVRKLVALDPENRSAPYLQAVLAARAGEDELARRLVWRANQGRDDQPAAAVLAAVLELRAANPAVALDILFPLAAAQPDNDRVQMLLARALAAHLDYPELLARFAGRAEQPGAPPYLIALVARAYEAQGARAAAAPLLDRVWAGLGGGPGGGMELLEPGMAAGVAAAHWRERPADIAAAIPYIRALITNNRAAEAARVADALPAVASGSADALTLAGDAHFAAGGWPIAAARSRAAARIRYPRSLMRKLAAAERADGSASRAGTVVRAWWAGRPLDGVAPAELGRAALADGAAGRAAALYEQAAGTSYAARNPSLFAALARASNAAEQSGRAATASALALALAPAGSGPGAVPAAIDRVRRTATRP